LTSSSERLYVASFLNDSLGLPEGIVDPASIPSELVSHISEAVRGALESASETPVLEEAVAMYLSDLETEQFEREGYFVRKARWPRGAPFAACLTHDVDNIKRPLSHIIRRASRFSFSDFVLALLGIRSLYNNIDLVAGLEARHGFRSSFYLLSKNYDLKQLVGTVGRLRGSGWEVGLHGDFGTHESKEAMTDAVTRLTEAFGGKPLGLREHFLKFDFAKTWEIAQSAGFVYDATVGNRDRLGFRLGLCTPFHPPDSGWRSMELVELPLVLMDTTLWGYLHNSEADGERDFEGLVDQVGAVNGLMTLLWHQESVRMKGGRIYPRLLEKLAQRGCFVGTGEQVARWWIERGNLLSIDHDSRVASMRSAPEGMVLIFKTGEGATLDVEGGVLSVGKGSQRVMASGGPLKVKVNPTK